VVPMNSSEVGRFRWSVMMVKVPSPLTFTSAPLFQYAVRSYAAGEMSFHAASAMTGL
jgi:hypothetical protein